VAIAATPCRGVRIVAAAGLLLAILTAPALAQSARARSGASGVEAELQKGIDLTRAGRFQEAIPHFLSIRGEVRDDYALSFNLALCYVATGQYEPAISLLNEIRSSGRANANVENLLTQALLGNRRPEEAYAAFERASRQAPKDENLYLYVAESCMGNGFYDVGLKVVQAGLKQLPRSARLVFEHGILLGHLDFLEEAKRELERVSGLAPGSDVAYIATAQKYLFESNVDEALRTAREGIRAGKRHFMLLALFGEAVLRSGAEAGSEDFAEARVSLEQAVASSPGYSGARLSLGKLYLTEGRMDDAVQHLEAARQLDPNNPAVYANLGAAYRKRGNIEQAEAMLAVLARLNREEVERIRSAPGDRKAGYVARPAAPKPPPLEPDSR